MDTTEIADIVARITEEVRAQMEPLMHDLYTDALAHGVAVIRTTDEGVIERVDPSEWDLVDTDHRA